MTQTLPQLSQFRIEMQDNGLVHFIFDCPDRAMNVFSNKAIHELGEFAEWLHRSDVRGVLVRSGKDNGFCAGADLTELGVAYEMIVAAPPADRFDMAYGHFFPLGHAIRRLETAGKPVAAAIGGVALGGGCELALGCHYRVLADTPRAMLGLPENQVGLLPGAGGTQRMPRTVGVEAGLDVLLMGRTYSGEEAVSAGLVHALAQPGDEVAKAEEWLLGDGALAVQPWDRPGTEPMAHSDLEPILERYRSRELARMLGHEPAPIAILDCVELGMMQPIDGGIRSEMSVFSALIQRPEPRNMIRSMFLGKQAYDKAARKDAISNAVSETAGTVSKLIDQAVLDCPALARAGFGSQQSPDEPVQRRVGPVMWIETQPDALKRLTQIAEQLSNQSKALNDEERLQLDHAVVRSGAVPAYVGGLTGLLSILEGVRQ